MEAMVPVAREPGYPQLPLQVTETGPDCGSHGVASPLAEKSQGWVVGRVLPLSGKQTPPRTPSRPESDRVKAWQREIVSGASSSLLSS